MTRLAPRRFALQLTVGQETHDKLRHAQALLGHQVATGDLAQVLDRALDALIQQLESQKFAATRRPRRAPRRPGAGTRHIPAQVRRAVWARDGGQCTFVSDSGQRCPARARLEFDHVLEVARGGEATSENLRLRCRAHNPYAAECSFGAGFMDEKRTKARRRPLNAVAAEARAARTRESTVTRGAAPPAPDLDVTPWLRSLGFRADEARRAAAYCEEALLDASLEDRVRLALRHLAPAHRRVPRDPSCPSVHS